MSEQPNASVMEAAERLRRHESGKESIGEVYPNLGFGFGPINDRQLLARWALPLLDETVATKQWFQAAGLEVRAIYQGDDWVPTLWHDDGWITMPQGSTRGAVRMLCLALQIELKEQAHD
jgi:hypothetical protein